MEVASREALAAFGDEHLHRKTLSARTISNFSLGDKSMATSSTSESGIVRFSAGTEVD